MKKFISLLALFFALLIVFAIPVSAASAYQTYTYNISGTSIHSPAAYTPVQSVDSNYMGLKTAIDDPRDMVVDKEYNVYIADAKNNRIVCLDRYYKVKFTIETFTNEHGVPDELTAPSGVFVTNDRIFVCDTDANRIVTFDRDGKYISSIPEPESELFEEGSVYKPVAIAVDQYDRLYVVSSTTYQGIIVMTDKGEFTGFIGAQKVTISAWDIIWRRFQTEDQRELTTAYVSTEFNNISINDEGFIYVTTSSIDENKQQSAIRSKSKSGDYAPVKMLNANGDEIMRRNGFYPPSGEVDISTSSTDGSIRGASKIIDVAIGPEKTWSIIDEKRNKVFTYDFDGNLLWAFGDSGTQLGNLSSIEAIAYQGDTLLILDKTNDNITVYKRTEYGNVVISALANENNRNYDLAIDDWMEILKRNSNFDTAYIGIGDSLYRSGEYEESLEYFKAAYDTAGYSNSYKEIRKEWISKWILTIPLGIVIIVFLFSKFNNYATKVNKRAATAGGKRTFKEELLYGFYVILHPFDGFWDLKHEKRGSVRAALVFIVITVLTFFYEAIGAGYVINPQGSFTTVWAQAISVLVPFLLFAVANWCLTTLFEGEGSFKDIVVAMSYSLLPLPMLIIPATIMSNVVISNEVKLLNLLTSAAFIWVGILLFFGTQVTHDYSLGKNMLTIFGTLIGMIFIMFIGILFTTLLGKIVSLISNIVIEITYRL